MRLPVRHAVLEADRAKPAPPQRFDRVDGQHAIRPPAVGDDFAIAGQFVQALLELGQWHRYRARDMTGGKLLRWTHVQDGRFALAHASPQGFAIHRLHSAARLQEFLRHPLDLGQAVLGEGPQGAQIVRHFPVRQTIGDKQPVLLRVHQSRRMQQAQMTRRVRHGHVRLVRQHFDRPRPLCQHIEQFQPLRTPQRFPHPGQVLEDRILELPVVHVYSITHIQLNN